jgi:AcrR family transcriptional regulator
MTTTARSTRFGDVRAVRSVMETDTRALLLNAAAALLSEQGPSALTVRRLASAVNGSTKMIYTHFGGMDGLFDALYRYSFEGLTQVFNDQSDEKDPFLRIEKMAIAYRDYAVREPSLYNVMFGDLGRAWQAPVASRREAWKSFEALRDAIRTCLPRARAAEGNEITYILWATMHGVVSLDLRKLLGTAKEGEKLYRSAVTSICVAHGLRQ